MERGAFWGILVQTFKVTIRSKWLIMFTIVFFFFAFNLPFISLQLLGILPANYVSSFIGTLITTSFALMPLLALPLGAVSLVEEREVGSLQFILSTPTSRWKFLAARAAGLYVATSCIIVLGFGLAALFGLSFSSASIDLLYVTIAALVLNASMIGISLMISTLSRKRLTASSMAILVWFIFTYASDSANVGPALGTASQYSGLLPWIFSNPVVISRLIATLQIPSGIEDIGPAGEAMRSIFHSGALSVLFGTMALWIAISLFAAFLIFNFQDVA